jgi:hypothetical protein
MYELITFAPLIQKDGGIRPVDVLATRIKRRVPLPALRASGSGER